MFAFYMIICTVLNFTLVPTIWAGKKQIDFYAPFALSVVVFCALVFALVQRRVSVRKPSGAGDLLSVNLGVIAAVTCFCLCGWPSPTRGIATALLASCTIWWWATAALRYLKAGVP